LIHLFLFLVYGISRSCHGAVLVPGGMCFRGVMSHDACLGAGFAEDAEQVERVRAREERRARMDKSGAQSHRQRRPVLRCFNAPGIKRCLGGNRRHQASRAKSPREPTSGPRDGQPQHRHAPPASDRRPRLIGAAIAISKQPRPHPAGGSRAGIARPDPRGCARLGLGAAGICSGNGQLCSLRLALERP